MKTAGALVALPAGRGGVCDMEESPDSLDAFELLNIEDRRKFFVALRWHGDPPIFLPGLEVGRIRSHRTLWAAWSLKPYHTLKF